MRVAIIHYWLVGMRGGERVLEQLCLMFPDADIYTHVCDREKLSPLLRRHRIRETFIARLPGAKKHYQKYLPLMPYALEQLDLSSYDLVLSSESGPAKGVICNPDTPHLCYTHSPMRYIWDQYHAYREGLSWPMRAISSSRQVRSSAMMAGSSIASSWSKPSRSSTACRAGAGSAAMVVDHCVGVCIPSSRA